MVETFAICTWRSQEDLQHVSHGDQMQDVQVVVGRADSGRL